MSRINVSEIASSKMIGKRWLSFACGHGEPTIGVEPSVAAPGRQITITGTDMEDGQVFKVTLDGASGVYDLGHATATQNGGQAGLAETCTLPSELTPGSCLLLFVAEGGRARPQICASPLLPNQ